MPQPEPPRAPAAARHRPDDQSTAPLLTAWERARSPGRTPFTIPGHKGRAGRLDPVLGQLLASDVPLYGGLDTVKLSAGIVNRAEQLAAALWSADWCRFSTGGSTHANQALTLAATVDGRPVLLSRSAHRSTLLGLVMSGARPVWLPTEIDSPTGIPVGITGTTLKQALEENPEASAVILVEPGYLGALSELPSLIDIAHRKGTPVLVDQAWAPHFGFAPELPPHALAVGADAMVISAHKTLPAYSQAALVLTRGNRLDSGLLDRAFDAAHTTSPAGSILASIDGARRLLATRGPELLSRLITLVAEARTGLRAAGLTVPGPEAFAAGRFDPTKLVVLTGPVSGNALEQDLLHADIPVEMADSATLVPIITMADDESTVDVLVSALTAAYRRRVQSGSVPVRRADLAALPLPEAPLTPRQAFFERHETVTAAAAVGRICAEVVAPYPPGVPALMPGEVITAELLDRLRALALAGTRVAYAADPTLDSFSVVHRD